MSSYSNRRTQLARLQSAVDAYAKVEKKQIEDTVAVLKNILNGRAGTAAKAVVSKAAENALFDYLKVVE